MEISNDSATMLSSKDRRVHTAESEVCTKCTAA